MKKQIVIGLIALAVLVGGYFLITVLMSTDSKVAKPSSETSLPPTDTTTIPEVKVPQGEVTVLPGDPGVAGSLQGKYGDAYVVPTEDFKKTFPKGNNFLIFTDSGTVEMNNLFNNLAGYYPEMKSALITQNDRYTLEYFQTDSQFSLTVSPLSVQSDMKQIQEELLATLGVDSANLCKLKINFLVEYDEVEIKDFGTLPLCSSVVK